MSEITVPDYGFNVEQVVKCFEFTEYSIEILGGALSGENYSSITLQAVITGKKLNKPYESVKVFVKRPSPNEHVRTVLASTKAYKNEYMAYNYLIPALYKLQDDIGMSVEDRFKTPRALAMSTEDHNEYVAMEDISMRNFQRPTRLEALGYDHLKLLLKRVANYHGTVMALKHTKRSVYEEMAKDISHDIYYELGVNDSVLTFVTESLKYLKDYMDPQGRQKADKFLENLPEIMDHYTSRKAAEPHDVICHGDLWSSNFWFKYDEDNIPVDVCILDWQLLRCGSLFTDLHYMVFLCTDSVMRKVYHKYIFDWYYTYLGDVLDKFGLDLATIYPKNEFKADEKKFAAHALVVSLSYTILTTADATNVPDMLELVNSDPERVKKELRKLSNKGKQRVREIINDYISYGYV